jgi:hypothetical protein
MKAADVRFSWGYSSDGRAPVLQASTVNRRSRSASDQVKRLPRPPIAEKADD